MNLLVMCRVCGNRRDITTTWSRIIALSCGAQSVCIAAVRISVLGTLAWQRSRVSVIAWRQVVQISSTGTPLVLHNG